MTSLELFPAASFAERLRAAVLDGVRRHKQREIADVLGCTEPNISVMIRANMTIASAEAILIAVEALDAAKATDQLAGFEVVG